ncbi:VOC family protein [Pyxidicoccus sp. 3LFB2]
MSIQAATPYFLLNGQVEKAISLYERALGARTETLQRFGDMPGGCPTAMKNRVMHAELRVGGALLMMSDGPQDEAVPNGGRVSVALAFDDPAELRRSFDALAATGQVIEPILDAPWGGLFGVVRDEFGIHWMVNSDTKAR